MSRNKNTAPAPPATENSEAPAASDTAAAQAGADAPADTTAEAPAAEPAPEGAGAPLDAANPPPPPADPEEGEDIAARALVDFAGYRAGDLVTAPAAQVEAWEDDGLVDSHPDAVAYAAEQAAAALGDAPSNDDPLE